MSKVFRYRVYDVNRDDYVESTRIGNSSQN